MGNLIKLVLVFFQRGNVGKHGDVLLNVALFIAHCANCISLVCLPVFRVIRKNFC